MPAGAVLPLPAGAARQMRTWPSILPNDPISTGDPHCILPPMSKKGFQKFRDENSNSNAKNTAFGFEAEDDDDDADEGGMFTDMNVGGGGVQPAATSVPS